ncbi:uncharacterized protein FN964_009547 [Alca torda]
MEKSSPYLLELLCSISSCLLGIVLTPAVEDLQPKPSSQLLFWLLLEEEQRFPTGMSLGEAGISLFCFICFLSPGRCLQCSDGDGLPYCVKLQMLFLLNWFGAVQVFLPQEAMECGMPDHR